MKIYRIKEAAEFLGFKIKTLQKWDREGRLKSRRTRTNRRFYLESDLLEFLGLEEGNGKVNN